MRDLEEPDGLAGRDRVSLPPDDSKATRPADYEAKEEKIQTGNVEEMVSSFLTELAALSSTWESVRDQVVQSESRSGQSADLPIEEPVEPRVVDVEDEALSLESEVAAEDLNLEELARTLYEFEMEQSRGGQPASRECAPEIEPVCPDPADQQLRNEPTDNLTPQSFFQSTIRRAGEMWRIRPYVWAFGAVLLMILAAVVFRVWRSGPVPSSDSAKVTAPPPASAAGSGLASPKRAEQANPAKGPASPPDIADDTRAAGRPSKRAVKPAANPTQRAAAAAGPKQDRAPLRPGITESASITGEASGAALPAVAVENSRPAADRPETEAIPAKPVVGSSVPVSSASPPGGQTLTVAPLAAPGNSTAVQSAGVPPAAAPAAGVSSAGDKPVDAASPVRVTPPTPNSSTPADSSKARENPAVAFDPPTLAAVVKRVVPSYPVAARMLGIKGTVVLDVDVDEKGAVVRAVATSGPAALRPAAEEALKRWQFKPATRDGKGIRSKASISIVFGP